MTALSGPARSMGASCRGGVTTRRLAPSPLSSVDCEHGPRGEGLGEPVAQVVRLRFPGETPFPYVYRPPAEAGDGVGLKRAVPAHELGRPAVVKAENIVEDEHLTVAVDSGSNAYRRHRHRVGDQLSDHVR